MKGGNRRKVADRHGERGGAEERRRRRRRHDADEGKDWKTQIGGGVYRLWERDTWRWKRKEKGEVQR